VARHSLVPSPVVGSVDAEGGLAASGVALSPAAAFDIPAVLGAVAQRQPMIFGWSRSVVPGLAGRAGGGRRARRHAFHLRA
jgi:hypothetical protein